jgi:hypothetical protein
MSSWAKKRQLVYLVGVLCVIAMTVFVPMYRHLNKPPTCFDGLQNGDETGVDCGGTCVARCLSEITPPIVYWSRAFKVEDGLYDVAALIENTNVVGSSEILYQFRMYDEDNLLIQDRMGKTFVLPNDKWMIFEGGIKTGEREPSRVFIEFLDSSTWTAIPLSDDDIPTVAVTGQRLEEKNGLPRVFANISNRSPFQIDDIEVAILISDADGNALGASRTYLEVLPKYGDENVVFTWREPFAGVPASIDIFPRVNYMGDISVSEIK